jgi:hypothetical protein
MTSYSPAEFHRHFEDKYCLPLQDRRLRHASYQQDPCALAPLASCWVLVWLTLRPWWGRQYVPLKLRWDSTWRHLEDHSALHTSQCENLKSNNTSQKFGNRYSALLCHRIDLCWYFFINGLISLKSLKSSYMSVTYSSAKYPVLNRVHTV